VNVTTNADGDHQNFGSPQFFVIKTAQLADISTDLMTQLKRAAL
jgi:hypothetical protein